MNSLELQISWQLKANFPFRKSTTYLLILMDPHG